VARGRNNTKLIFESDDSRKIEVYKFTPKLWRLYPKSIAPYKGQYGLYFLSFFARYFFGKYLIYTIRVQGALIGWEIVNTNYLRKFPFLNCDSYIIKPYYICPEFRGRGYSKILLNAVDSDMKGSVQSIFAIVHRDNVPSQKALVASGYYQNGFVKYDVGGVSSKRIW